MVGAPDLADTVHRLRGDFDGILASLLSGIDKVALLDFPDHGNVGDSAIWLGEVTALRNAGVKVVYAATRSMYRREAIRARLGDSGAVLLTGGGNFGDLWGASQTFRERVVRDFPDHLVVQLPQSIHFEDPGRLQESIEVFSSHSRVHLLVRDRRSLEIARQHVGERALLCPDAAFSLQLRRAKVSTQQILRLLRRDKESAAHESSSGGVALLERNSSPVPVRDADWPPDPLKPVSSRNASAAMGRRVYFLKRRLLAVAQDTPRINLAPGVAERWAEKRLLGGVSVLSQAPVAITDRLHGHILCLLLGIQHVVLDNSYGKVSRFVETWNTTSEHCVLAANLLEANDIALEWFASGIDFPD